jgi:hypothetical protein
LIWLRSGGLGLRWLRLWRSIRLYSGINCDEISIEANCVIGVVEQDVVVLEEIISENVFIVVTLGSVNLDHAHVCGNVCG